MTSPPSQSSGPSNRPDRQYTGQDSSPAQPSPTQSKKKEVGQSRAHIARPFASNFVNPATSGDLSGRERRPTHGLSPSMDALNADGSATREAGTWLVNSVTSLESTLRECPPYALWSARQWARQWIPKAIVVCDALEASLTGPPVTPEMGLVMRGELSAHVLQNLPWESLGIILGLDRKHPSLSELNLKIRDFVEVVEAGDTSQDLLEPLKTLAAYDAAVEAVRGLRSELKSVASILVTPEADNIAEVALGKLAPLDAADSLTDSAMRIGAAVLVCSTLGAPLGAMIFHEPLLSAGAKAGITSLIGSTTAELVNHEIKSRKLHSPEAAFARCHDQLLTSLENYSALTAGASWEELVVARAHLVTDAYAARLATIRLDWPYKSQYWKMVEGLQNEIDRDEEPQTLTVWLPRLQSQAQSLKARPPLKAPSQLGTPDDLPIEDQEMIDPKRGPEFGMNGPKI